MYTAIVSVTSERKQILYEFVKQAKSMVIMPALSKVVILSHVTIFCLSSRVIRNMEEKNTANSDRKCQIS